MFPNKKCNCPSTTTCWHIIVSKLSLGIHNVIPTKQNINLSQLKRNSRTRVDKKSGRKPQRSNDTDTKIIPAPDSQETILAMGNIGSLDKKPKLTNIAKHGDLLDTYGCGDVIDIESIPIDTSGHQALENAILGK